MTKRIISFLISLTLLAACAFAQGANTEQQLTSMLRTFLDGAAKGDKAAFERFFAEDVIYTRGSGVVIDRASILKSVEPPKPGEATPTYDAEDIQIHEKADVAIVNFRLVVHGDEQGKPKNSYYRNTGTFLRQNGEWKVIAWQATPIAESK